MPSATVSDGTSEHLGKEVVRRGTADNTEHVILTARKYAKSGRTGVYAR